MTTKTAYRIQTVIDYDSLSYNPDDPEPLPDGMYQYPILSEVSHLLGAHISSLYSPEEAFQSSNTFICYDPSDLNVRVGPDFYAAFGVDAKAIERRKLYLPWEVGKPPDFVLEVASVSTARHDITIKRDIYARIGVAEYWRFDRTGGEFYREPLAGDILENGVYQPVSLTTEPDGILKGYSPALRLTLCWRDEMLVFYNRDTGEYMRNLPQAEAALRAERAARESADAALAVERAALRGEQSARESAEATIRRLTEELRNRERE